MALQAECYTRLADLYWKVKDTDQAKALFQTVASQKPKSKSEGLSPFVGYARYRIATMAEEDAHFEPLKFPEATLQKALNQRLSFLEPLSRSYQNVVQVGGPWAIAALNRLALWANRFADEMDHIEPPASLQGKSLEKFRKDLASISGPIRQKAQSTWNDGLNKSLSSLILSPVLPEISDHLADLQTPKVGRAQGPRGKLHLAGISATGGSEGLAVDLQKVRERLLKNAKDVSAWSDYGNLLWGEAKPLMAKIAYEQAIALNPKSIAALNNLAVVQLSSEGEEDWVVVNESVRILEEALRIDDFYLPAKMNLATLLNYYRLFPKAKKLWEQVLVRSSGAQVQQDAELGLAIAQQGLAEYDAAELAFQNKVRGDDIYPFILPYHEAARLSRKGTDGASDCVSRLEKINENQVRGFEKQSVQYLKGICEKWKESK